MLIQNTDKVTQIKNGFIVQRSDKIYYTNNNFEIIQSYNIKADFITIDGLIVNNTMGFILDINSGRRKLCPHFHGITDNRYLYKLLIEDDELIVEYYDNEKESWYNRINIYSDPDTEKVVYNYTKQYETRLDNNFLFYFYTNNKSILVYENHLEIYEGELYSIERLEDLLEEREDALFDDEYAELIKVFEVEYSDQYKYNFLPNHIIFKDTILNLSNFKLYHFDIDRNQILGVIGNDIITANNNITLTEEIKNLL